MAGYNFGRATSSRAKGGAGKGFGKQTSAAAKNMRPMKKGGKVNLKKKK